MAVLVRYANGAKMSYHLTGEPAFLSILFMGLGPPPPSSSVELV